MPHDVLVRAICSRLYMRWIIWLAVWLLMFCGCYMPFGFKEFSDHLHNALYAIRAILCLARVLLLHAFYAHLYTTIYVYRMRRFVALPF